MAAQRNAKPAAQAPVSAHPLFPAIVALWFAALLGVGSMLLPQALFDQIGASTGTAAAGFGFRIGFGLVAGLAGAVIGVLLARKVAAGHTPQKPRQRTPAAHSPQTGARKPISAMEELGSDRLDEPVDDPEPVIASEPMSGRRRALTVTDESEPSEYLMRAPLPGSEEVLDLIGADDFEQEDALELGSFDHEEDQPVPAFARPQEPPRPAQALFPAEPFAASEPAPDAPPPFAPAPTAGAGVFRAPEPTPAGQPWQSEAPFAPPPAQPFAPTSAPAPAPAFARMPEQGGATVNPAPFAGAPFSMPVPEPANHFGFAHAAPPPAPAPEPAFQPRHDVVQPDDRHAEPHADLAALDTVALVERFARALRNAGDSVAVQPEQARFEAPAPKAPAAPFAPAQTGQFGAFTSPEASHAVAPAPVQFDPPAPFSAPTLPAALTPISFDDPEEHDEIDERFVLPVADQPKPFAQPAETTIPQPFSMPEAAALYPTERDDEDPEGNEDSFGSLLAMKAGYNLARDAVRVDEDDAYEGPAEPVVVFPGTAPQGRAVPAPDGPSRDPASAPAPAHSPFAAPAAPRVGQPMDRNATEAALRDALARLQQMSGAA